VSFEEGRWQQGTLGPLLCAGGCAAKLGLAFCRPAAFP